MNNRSVTGVARYHRQRDDSALGQARALIAPTLEQAQASGLTLNVLRVYVSKLLSQFGADFPIKSIQPTGDTLIEPLTERELEVLRLIAQGLSNREIGE